MAEVIKCTRGCGRHASYVVYYVIKSWNPDELCRECLDEFEASDHADWASSVYPLD